jgi:hypothetical protein
MVKLDEKPLASMDSGGGVVARNRYLYALERQGDRDGALVVFDATNPEAIARKTAIALGGFPRDLALIPGYSFRLHPGLPVQTKDLLAVVGGKLGVSAEGTAEGSGQYLKVFDISDPTNARLLASTLVSPGGTAAITKLAWSPPVLGLLEAEADVTAVSLVNLQLFIHAQNLTGALLEQEPDLGSAGLDLNGDGDFVDSGDELPRVERLKPRSGVINGGLVAAYSLRDRTTQRFTDFSMELGGKLISVVTTRGVKIDSNGNPTGQNVDPAYITLVSGGARLEPDLASVPLPFLPKRVATLLDRQWPAESGEPRACLPGRRGGRTGEQIEGN